jgi:hypothetical protein
MKQKQSSDPAVSSAQAVATSKIFPAGRAMKKFQHAVILLPAAGDISFMNSRLGDLAISDTGFIFDPGTGATFNVNATGLIALAALREGVDAADTAELAARVRARFPTAPPDVGEHVSDFVRTLRQIGILAAPGARS